MNESGKWAGLVFSVIYFNGACFEMLPNIDLIFRLPQTLWSSNELFLNLFLNVIHRGFCWTWVYQHHVSSARFGWISICSNTLEFVFKLHNALAKHIQQLKFMYNSMSLTIKLICISYQFIGQCIIKERVDLRPWTTHGDKLEAMAI